MTDTITLHPYDPRIDEITVSPEFQHIWHFLRCRRPYVAAMVLERARPDVAGDVIRELAAAGYDVRTEWDLVGPLPAHAYVEIDGWGYTLLRDCGEWTYIDMGE